MILPDVNLLVYAYNAGAPEHEASRRWWEGVMNGGQQVVLPWAVICGFVRLMTNRRVIAPPLTPDEAFGHVQTWLSRSHVQVLAPGPGHFAILRDLLVGLGVAAGLTTDAHLAALAIEHQVELQSNDADFARFPGLRWTNPLHV